jgi:DmsE family decaheme c-type cytochrome
MRRLGLMFVGLGTSLCVVSAVWFGGCASSRKQALLPAVMTQKAPDATPVGSEACEDCHDDPPAFYKESYHRLAFFQEGKGVGCESCHGNGSIHVDNGDYEGQLVGSEDLESMNEAERTALCQTCHQDDFPLWPTTDHARSQVGCWDCHPGDLHSPPGQTIAVKPKIHGQSDYEYCVQCHESTGLEFNLQFHHRVPEEQMKCGDCHPIHGEPRTNPLVQEQNGTCNGCHPEIRGPWVFEHLGMDEGCESCHAPHGSINNKLLVSNDNSLCIQCHFQEPYGFFGRQPHAQFLSGGALCYDCHFQVHGSNTDRNFNPRRQ